MINKILNYFRRAAWMLLFALCSIQANQHLCIVIPAYNEEKRIEKTLVEYCNYFKTKPEKTTFLVVANNCCDNTVGVVEKVAKTHKNIKWIVIESRGKGFAVKQGFLWALENKKYHFDLIGFVDADMATLPQYFYDLVIACKDHDGAIASRYIKGAVVEPARPWGRVLGGKMYNWMLRMMSGLSYKDTQCGAKLFNKDTIEKVTPNMQEIGWAFDLELLYLCKMYDKNIAEIPTTWSDQPGSHLEITSKLMQEFLASPKRIKQRHAQLRKQLKKQKTDAIKNKRKKSDKK